MNAFELDRLRREGKEVTLSGGRRALAVVEGLEFEESDKRLEHWLADLRERQKGEQRDMEEKHGLLPAMDLGC